MRTTMLYGIWATGTTPAGLKHLIMQMVTMQRMIYKNHSYRTKDSHEAFFHDRQLEPPHLFLHRCCLRLLRVHQDKWERLPQDDILHGLELHGPRNLLEHLALLGTGGPGQSDIATPFECSTCGICFCSTQALLAHEGKEHGIKHGRIQVFRAVRDATEGTPVCRHCSHSFPTWTALRNHVEHAYCPHFVPLQVMSSSLKDIRTCLVPQIQRDDPDTISLDSLQGDYLRCHCILCGMQLTRFQDMAHHIALEHTALATVSTGLYQHWSGSMRSPCCFCPTADAPSC